MMTAENPLLADWTAPFALPPFAQIRCAHFLPAFKAALTAHRAEIDAIAVQKAAPDFTNTAAALERSGQLLRRVSAVFHNLVSADSNTDLQRIEREIAPRLARHLSQILLNRRLYARIAAIPAPQGAEEARVLERYHSMFARAGAKLPEAGRDRMREIMQRLATLGAQFSQNVLADENNFELILKSGADLAGLPEFFLASTARAAADRGAADVYVVTLSRSIIEPFLQFSTRRDLREKAFRAWVQRGANGGETDNRAIAAEILALRAERAALLDYDSFAAFKLDDQMAGAPDAVRELLMRIWAPARRRAGAERDKLQALIDAEGGDFALAPWDWRHYAERQRKLEYDIDETEVKPYLQLDQMIEAAFDTAKRLFGLNFRELPDAPRYHPDVRVFEVRDAQGDHMGVFMGDYFSRPYKRGGAWMSAFRSQERVSGDIRPVIVNVMNFARGAEGEASLLTFDDARTLFHEFGHALHGLLSDVTYPIIAGTNVARDFVELPSQLYEHWLSQPEVLGRFAAHYRTGAPMPEDLLRRLLAAATFNQGFATVEYLSSALVDLDLHLAPRSAAADPMAIEAQTLAHIDMPAEISPRHATPHFAHVFADDGYSAGYYSYMWSEVMDADAFCAFTEAGDPFDPETALHLRENIYAAGGRRDPAEAYAAFRGRPPQIGALLAKRGLAI